MHASERQTRIRRVVLAAIMGATLGFATHARAQDDDSGDSRKITCADGQSVMVESKTCPPTGRRGAVVVQRACCTKFTEKNPASEGGKTRCKSFPHCPRNSPS
jgi:hypothetical protein